MKIKYIIIHHSAVSRTQNYEQFTAINNYHKRKGWGMIGYHYLIEPSGELKIGRKENQIGAHCIGHNHDSLGICLTGNFDIEYPTKKQEKELRTHLIHLSKKYPFTIIKYHRNFANKSCPGELIEDNWLSNTINTNTMFVKKIHDNKIYTIVENKLIHFNTNWNTFSEIFENAIVIELNKKEFAKFEIISNVSIKK